MINIMLGILDKYIRRLMQGRGHNGIKRIYIFYAVDIQFTICNHLYLCRRAFFHTIGNWNGCCYSSSVFSIVNIFDHFCPLLYKVVMKIENARTFSLDIFISLPCTSQFLSDPHPLIFFLKRN